MNTKTLITQHGKEYGLKPGQQLNVMLTYLCVRVLFPEITLQQYLERAPAMYGANDENRLYPKDALDHWCPTKGSAWPPEKRLELLSQYNDFLMAVPPGTPPMSLEQMLAYVLAEQAPPPPVLEPTVPVAQAAPAAAAPAVSETAPLGLAPPAPPGFVPPTVVPVDAAVPPGIPAAAAPIVTPGVPTVEVPPDFRTLEAVLKLPVAKHREINGYLQLPGPVGTTPLGGPLSESICALSELVVHLDIVNAQPKPYIDVYCRDLTGNPAPIGDLPPVQDKVDVSGIYTILVPSLNIAVRLVVPQ